MMSFQFDLALGGWTGDYDPTSYPNQFEASYAHNHAQWKAQELTDLINALNNEDGTDFAARWEHLRQANAHLIDNAVGHSPGAGGQGLSGQSGAGGLCDPSAGQFRVRSHPRLFRGLTKNPAAPNARGEPASHERQRADRRAL